ncbi:MAG: FG-GAP repeat protein, partial [Planctomycetota bacterium]
MASGPVKLLAPDAAAGDSLGYRVALSGDTLLLGAPGVDDAGAGSGSAYVYRWSGGGWMFEAKLAASDAAGGDAFGAAVAIDGDTALIGAHRDDDAGLSSGSAYVFVRSGTTWTEQTKLAASDATGGDHFGFAVALDGNTALVGANEDDDVAGSDQGAAYVFVRTGASWAEQDKLLASDATSSDQFGRSVALDGDTALIGAVGNDDGGSASGSAYVFVRSAGSWTEQAKLKAGDSAADDIFGSSVAIDGDTALVGAQLDDDAGGIDQGSAYVFVRSAGSWTEQAKLTADDGDFEDYFGYSVALDGDTALIGAWGDDDSGGSDQGSSYVFTRAGTMWTQQARLMDSDGGTNDFFGAGVALEGDTALIGASGDTDAGGIGQGSAHVIERLGSVWVGPELKVFASDAAAGDRFGHTLVLDGDTALIGAYFDDDAGANSGSAYVFVRTGTTWLEQAKLVASDAAAGDNFGVSVALDGDTALVGAHNDDDLGGADQGSAYVFVRTGTTWTEQAKLTASDAFTSDNFGRSVAIDNDTALVGSYFDTDGLSNIGSAYVFTRTGTTWTEQDKLVASDADTSDNFGISAALDGDTALIGSFNDDDAGLSSGSAYVFVRSGTTWNEQAKLVASDAAADDQFGISVAIDVDTALIGAYDDDDVGGLDQGSAYVFVRSGTVWTEQDKLTASDASAND